MPPAYSSRISEEGLRQDCSRSCMEEVTSWHNDNRSMWRGEREKQMSLKKEPDARSWKTPRTKLEIYTAGRC